MGVSFVQAYVVSNVLLVGALGLVALVMRWSASTPRPLSFRQQLLFAYALMITAVIAPWFAMTSQSADFLPTTAQVWAAPSMDAATVPAVNGGHATISFTSENAGLSLDSVSRVARGSDEPCGCQRLQDASIHSARSTHSPQRQAARAGR
jgi:hypothetical protein